jgi:large subunit ribosomal protein L24
MFTLILIKVEFKTPNRREYLPKKREHYWYRFTSNRPWTEEWKRQNETLRRPVIIEPVKEWNFFRGDRVEVLVGRDRGKHGIVSQVS